MGECHLNMPGNRQFQLFIYCLALMTKASHYGHGLVMDTGDEGGVGWRAGEQMGRWAGGDGEECARTCGCCGFVCTHVYLGLICWVR